MSIYYIGGQNCPTPSCLSALLVLDSNSSVDMVYLEFSKAFDKVDYGILLHKLTAVGIIGNIGIWLFHFLTDRSHFVQLPGVLVKTTLS